MGTAFFWGMFSAATLLVIAVALLFDAFVFYVPHEKSFFAPILLAVIPSIVATVGFDLGRNAKSASVFATPSTLHKLDSYFFGIILGLCLLPASIFLLPWMKVSQAWGSVCFGLLFLCGGIAGGYFFGPIRQWFGRKP